MSRLNYSTAYGIANPNAMAGGGVGRVLKEIRSIAHKVKPASTINRLVKIAGVGDQLDAATNGAYSRGIDYGLSKGYGRKKRSGKKRGKK